MREQELWEYFHARAVAISRPFDREFVWVTRQDFEPVREHFIPEFNMLHAGISLRSRGWIGHIHAVEQGDVVFLHPDTGNIARFFPLGLVHLFVDVIPYVVFACVRRTPMKSLFEYSADKTH